MMRKSLITIVLTLVLLPIVSLYATPAEAATLSNAKDTITNSRPSAAAWLNANYASTDTTVTLPNNGSRYLASDSARFLNNAGTPLGSIVTVASQSADLTTVYLANSSGTAAGRYSDVLITPQTAKHTITFTTINSVAVGGKIVVTFPGSGSNVASPSASTFSFNGIASGNITYSPSAGTSTCGTLVISAPTITCTIATATLNAGVTVTYTLGSTTPQIINPTKTVVAGTNDSWRVTLQTTDSGGIIIDDAKIAIGTIDSVKVTADVDPSLTFTIAGITSGNVSSAVTSCTGPDALSGVPASTATEVSLGFLRSTIINLSAQKLTVSTNGSQGYVISATSSGQFINPATGYWIRANNKTGASVTAGDGPLTANDVPAPLAFQGSGSEGFGISACGARVTAGTWGAAGCTTNFATNTCLYSNPWNTGTNSYYATLASYSGGPVTSDDTAVKYAATISGTTPPGTYRTIFTYVATATF